MFSEYWLSSVSLSFCKIVVSSDQWNVAEKIKAIEGFCGQQQKQEIQIVSFYHFRYIRVPPILLGNFVVNRMPNYRASSASEAMKGRRNTTWHRVGDFSAEPERKAPSLSWTRVRRLPFSKKRRRDQFPIGENPGDGRKTLPAIWVPRDEPEDPGTMQFAHVARIAI